MMTNYQYQFYSENITINSGIGETIGKEEWREDIIGNLFYPIEGEFSRNVGRSDVKLFEIYKSK